MPITRSYIPDGWAHLMKCPVCFSTPLRVERCEAAADRMHCSRCGTAFEVEQGGSHFHVVKLPAMIPQEMLGKWLLQAEIQDRVRQATLTTQVGVYRPAVDHAPGTIPVQFSYDLQVNSLEAAEVNQPSAKVRAFPAPLSGSRPFSQPIPDRLPGASLKGNPELPLEVIEHAKQLYQLGNSPAKVREILSRTENLRPAQMELIMAPIQAAESNRRVRTRNGVLIALGILLLVASCIALTVFLMSGSIPPEYSAG